MGSLTVVGTGIQLSVHLTGEGRDAIELADEVLFLGDAAIASWIERLNPNSTSLHVFYKRGAVRREIYEAIADEIVGRVRAGGEVCVAFPGHPGLFADAPHEAIRRVRAEGLEARMLPGISAEDCLFADLGIDPGRTGWQSYEATNLLVYRHAIDPSAALVLWQVGIVGNVFYEPEGDRSRLPVLAHYLADYYARDHEVVLYEASPFPVFDPTIRRVPLRELPDADVAPLATLYVPPSGTGRPDAEMVELLGLGVPHRHSAA